MVALASIDDYQLIIGPILDRGDAARIEGLLELASEAVLAGAHGQTIVRATSTVVLAPQSGVIYLPQRPVVSVASVAVGGTTLATTGYRLDQGGNRRSARLVRRQNGYDDVWRCGEVTVTYTHGWETVPALIKAAVCTTAQGVLQGSATTELTVDQNGQAVEQFPSNRLALLAMKLPPATQAVIDAVCGLPGPSSVPMARTP